MARSGARSLDQEILEQRSGEADLPLGADSPHFVARYARIEGSQWTTNQIPYPPNPPLLQYPLPSTRP